MSGAMNGNDAGAVLPEAMPSRVGFELQPYPSMENVQGGALILSAGEGEAQVKLGASLGPDQLRELAARMLILADTADQRTRTILMVTLKSAWLPHQVLQVRDTTNGAFHYEFLIKSQLAVPAKEKLIIPG